MEDLLVFAAAVVLIVLGARGTYAGVWNRIFPNMPLTGGTPTALPPTIDLFQGAGNAVGQGASTIGQGIQQVGNAAGTGTSAIKNIVSGTNTTSSKPKVITGGSVYKPTIVTTGGWASQDPSTGSKTGASYNQPYGPQPYPSNTGKPSWWPSWLLWPGDLVTYQGG